MPKSTGIERLRPRESPGFASILHTVTLMASADSAMPIKMISMIPIFDSPSPTARWTPDPPERFPADIGKLPSGQTPAGNRPR